MFSRAPQARQAQAPNTVSETKRSSEHFSVEETPEAASPGFAYSFAGIHTFPPGEDPESPSQRGIRTLPRPIQARADAAAVNAPPDHAADPAAAPEMRVPEPGATTGPAAPLIVQKVLRSPGEPLPAATRTFLERRFGWDFTGVRVHADLQAAESAIAINARAYTAGQHMVFNAGQYRPRNPGGIELLAHELAHTVQQRSVPIDEAGLPMGRDEGVEREARSAAGSALLGRPVSVRQGTAASVQRAEFGTYVSTVTSQPEDNKYLDAGFNFYRTWGHPNVQRVPTLAAVLDNLDTSPGPIDEFRLVAHGLGESLEIGLIPQFENTTVGKTEIEFTSEEQFRGELAMGPKLLSDSAFDDLITDLQKNPQVKPLLDTVGAGSKTPKTDSALGIMLKAMCETAFLNNVQLDVGGSPQIANRGVLDEYNRRRISTYRAVVIKEADPKVQANVSKAANSLETEIPAALKSRQWDTISQDDAKHLADPFMDDKTKRLKKSLAADIQEGGGRPFLKRLRSVRKKISSKTQIEVRGCNIGAHPEFMDQLRAFFGNPGDLPAMSAPDLFQYYFRLGYRTVTKAPADEAKLQKQFDDPTTGLAQGYFESALIRAKKVIKVVEEKTLAEVSKAYGVDEAILARLNPGVGDQPLKAGSLIWLAKQVPAGPHTSLEDFCEKALGNKYLWPTVWALNPQIMNPKKLQPSDLISIAPDKPSPSFPDLLQTLRSGQAVAVVESVKEGKNKDNPDEETYRPKVYLDDAQRAQALGKWLAQQKWDPKGRTADVLSKIYAANFSAAADKTYVEFLSRTYPAIEDPIFPDDPRYQSHIIKRP